MSDQLPGLNRADRLTSFIVEWSERVVNSVTGCGLQSKARLYILVHDPHLVSHMAYAIRLYDLDALADGYYWCPNPRLLGWVNWLASPPPLMSPLVHFRPPGGRTRPWPPWKHVWICGCNWYGQESYPYNRNTGETYVKNRNGRNGYQVNSSWPLWLR